MCEEMDRDPATIRRTMVNLVARVGHDRKQAMEHVLPAHRMHDDLIVAGTSAFDQVEQIAAEILPVLSNR